MLLPGVISSAVLASAHQGGETDSIMIAGEGSNFYNGYVIDDIGSFNHFPYGVTITNLYTTSNGVITMFTLIFGLEHFIWGRSLTVNDATLTVEGSTILTGDYMFVPDEEYLVVVNDGASTRGATIVAGSETVGGKLRIGYQEFSPSFGTRDGQVYKDLLTDIVWFYTETGLFGATDLLVACHSDDVENRVLVILGYGSYDMAEYYDGSYNRMIVPNVEPFEDSEEYTVYFIDKDLVPDPNSPVVASFYPGDDGTGKNGFSDGEYGTARNLDLAWGTSLKRLGLNDTTLTVVLSGDQTGRFENYTLRISDMGYNVFSQSPYDAPSVYDPGEDETVFTFSNAIFNFNELWLYAVDIVPISQESYANLAVIEVGSMGGITGYRIGLDAGPIGSIVSPHFGRYELYAMHSNGAGVITIVMEGTPSLVDQRFRVEGGSQNIVLDPAEASVLIDGHRCFTQWRWTGKPNLSGSFYDVTIEDYPVTNLETVMEVAVAGDCAVEVWSDDVQFTMVVAMGNGLTTTSTALRHVTEYTEIAPPQFAPGNWKADGTGGIIIPPGVNAIEVHASVELSYWQVEAGYRIYVCKNWQVEGAENIEPETWRVTGSAGFNDNVYSIIIPYLEVEEGDVISVAWRKSTSNSQGIIGDIFSFLHVAKVA